MYRPKGWDKYIAEQEDLASKTRSIAGGFSEEDFEAGADAMLEGLKKDAVSLEVAERAVWHGNGYLVFIPEEE